MINSKHTISHSPCNYPVQIAIAMFTFRLHPRPLANKGAVHMKCQVLGTGFAPAHPVEFLPVSRSTKAKRAVPLKALPHPFWRAVRLPVCS